MGLGYTAGSGLYTTDTILVRMSVGFDDLLAGSVRANALWQVESGDP